MMDLIPRVWNQKFTSYCGQHSHWSSPKGGARRTKHIRRDGPDRSRTILDILCLGHSATGIR